jgi:hypothetical protein
MASATIKRVSAPAGAGGQAQVGSAHGLPRLGSRKAALALAAAVAIVLGCFFAFPTYPTYDSLYALLWGRELLHLQLPDIGVYRAPTEHPLAIAFGVLCSLFGQAGARLMVLGSIASFLALTAGVYRLVRMCFGALCGVLGALLVLSRFFVENLALQGYLDVTYVALVIWAAALEAQRPRRGVPVQLLLCAAGLLRPEAWLLGGVYWLWCAWPALRSTGAPRLGQLGLAALAPLVWMGLDTALTGDPLYSLHSTSGLAQELGRSQGLGGVLSSTWSYSVRIDKLPVVLGGVAGLVIASALVSRLAPRRRLHTPPAPKGLHVPLGPRRLNLPLASMGLIAPPGPRTLHTPIGPRAPQAPSAPRGLQVPFALVACLLLAFVSEGAAGASVLDRYMLAGAIALLPFCALALGGWSLLGRGSRLRAAWMIAAGALVLFGALQVNATLSLSSLRDTLDYHEQLDQGLSDALHSPSVRTALRRCPLLSLPNNKLLPDALWLLPGREPASVLARSQARELAGHGESSLAHSLAHASIAVYPLPVTHFFDAVAGVGEERGAAHPPSGFRLIFSSRNYAVYANC